MVKWWQNYKTKIKDGQVHGNQIWSNLMEQYNKVMDTRIPSYSRMNGITFIMIPEEVILIRGLSKCINWKKVKKG